MALWQTLQRKQSHRVYVQVNCQPYKRPDRWEPWKDNRIPETRFVEFFRLSLADFNWLSDELRDELQQDLLGRGEPLTVEAQVAVGLYRLGHGATYVTIGHLPELPPSRYPNPPLQSLGMSYGINNGDHANLSTAEDPPVIPATQPIGPQLVDLAEMDSMRSDVN
ncbi:hypothetical protein PCASD_00192 [Puccinia coronata f. sp. avenae]|uniref:Uncharacterized protein n=1 Tax=Puccinia coronata f. sp. avenae TaxID=200324 RepID=A0A2N5VQZ0_9BASI|nr:hypothetical protein PCASD_00192 [Puccinia coronata f. sp. avenae]